MRGQTRAHRDYLAPGEKIVAYDTDMGDGDYWFLTAAAIYVIPTPTKSNERLQRRQFSRIPLDDVIGFSVNDRGAFMERVLETQNADGDRQVITCWYDGRRVGARLDDAIRDALADRR